MQNDHDGDDGRVTPPDTTEDASHAGVEEERGAEAGADSSATISDDALDSPEQATPETVPEEPADAVTVEEPVDEATSDAEVRRQMRRMTRRGFFWAAVAAGAAYGGWSWLISRPEIGRLPWPFRRALETNEKIAEAYFSPKRRIHEWSLSKADPNPRINGGLGLDRNADLSTWRLRIEGLASGRTVELTLDDIRQLPKREMVTEFRCIEGWSMFVHWGGARLADLMALHPPATRDGSISDPVGHPEKLVRYVAMETPGRGYYVGLDMPSAIHPQTLLVYEINGEPLSWQHGAPLRLAIPVKYGIKNIKRIGLIRYADSRPADYWAEQKYDWYAGL